MLTLGNIHATIKNNSKVAENYFFMTALQVISTAFGILIYPYVIRKLGAESYGIFAFSTAIFMYFNSFVSFGFNLPALKRISENKNDVVVKSSIVSAIFSSKLLLSIPAILVYLILINTIPFFELYKALFLIILFQISAEVINPIWYFQGIEKMKVITYFQLFSRIASVPFILYFVQSPNDLMYYAIIVTLSILLPALAILMYMIVAEKLKLHICSIGEITSYFKQAFPFFGSSIAGIIKQESVTVIVGTILGMREVAIYDLANKLIVLPRMLTNSINTALFPKISNKLSVSKIKKLIRYEWYIGLASIVVIFAFSYPAILLLGGTSMLPAFWPTVMLSVTVLVWLVVGCYISFVFMPRNMNSYVVKNQIVALIAFIAIVIPALSISQTVFSVTLALALSGIAEMLYCNIVIQKHKLL